MSVIIQGTDSVVIIDFKKDVLDVSMLESLEADVFQGDTFLTKTLKEVILDIENNAIQIPLSASQTLSFSASVLNIQFRYKVKGDNKVKGTYIYPVKIYPLPKHTPYSE